MQVPATVQVSISGQALVFVVRDQRWSLMTRAGAWTYGAFFAAQARRIFKPPGACMCPSLIQRSAGRKENSMHLIALMCSGQVLTRSAGCACR